MSFGNDARKFDRHLRVRNGGGRLEPMTVEPAEPAAEPVAFAPYGDFEADCPARMAVDLFGNSWLPVIVYMLREGPMRPGDLRATIGGISQKMLTQTLRRMEQITLIERRRYAEAPPRVEYELTAAGRDLLIPIYALGDWADRHGNAVRAAMSGTDEDWPPH
jgi:DNA-binding HxlR family transcriptional regulator